MNDKEFRKNCKVLANDIVAEHVNWKKSLDVPQDWHIRMSNTSVLRTAALLYIAANMPIPNERAKKPCTFCDSSKPINRDEAPSHYIYIDNKQKQLVDVCNGEEARFAIKYCPDCGRKL